MLADLKLAPVYDGLLFLVEAARNPPIVRSHSHVELELNLVVRGTISYVVGGRRFTFGPRSLLWLFPSQEHQVVARTSDAQSYVAVFKPDLIARSCRSRAYAGLKRSEPEVDGILHTILLPHAFDLVRKTMASLMDGAPDPDVLNREAGFGAASGFTYEHADADGLNAGLHHLLLLCWRHQRAGEEFSAPILLHPSVRKALQLLGEGGLDLNLRSLARRCGASEWHLSRMFSQQIGVPLTEYRNGVRLDHFLELNRRNTQQTLIECVLSAGFGSYAQFYRVFTKAYGCGPRRGLGVPFSVLSKRRKNGSRS